MTRNRTRMRRLSGLALGGALLLAPMSAALADEPKTATQADEMAQKADQQAAQYREMGAVGYKSGLVQRSEADANRYTSQAEQLEPAGESVVIISPAVSQRAEVVDQARLKGAVAYKTGMVQRAEAEQQKAEDQAIAMFWPEPKSTAAPVPPDCTADKPGAVPPGCPK